MTPKNPLQKRAQQIFKTYVTPAFQKAGFTKQGVTYLRHLNQIVHIVDIQQSPTNRVYEISFALNCGVYIPGVKAALWKGPEPTKLIAADGLFDVRPGSLLPVAGKSWWDL